MNLADSAHGGTGVGVVLFLVVVVGGLYFLPTIVAFLRGVPNKASVLVVNLFLGLTGVGWVVAMAMAARSVPPSPALVNVYANQNVNGAPMLSVVPPAPGLLPHVPGQSQAAPQSTSEV